METEGARVFISYSSRDGDECARKIRNRLQNEGISSWFAPEDLKSGWWPRTIVEKIRDCEVVLLILSQQSNQSEEVYREVVLAAGYHKQLVYFKLAADLEPRNELKYFLSPLQFQPGFPPPPEQHHDALVAAIRDALKWPPLPPAPPRKVSRVVTVGLTVAFVLLACLSLWAQQCTSLDWWAYVALASTVLLPLLLYNVVIPDVARPWLVLRLREAFTNPGMGLRAGVAGLNLALLAALLYTATVGTVQVIATDGVIRPLSVWNGNDWVSVPGQKVHGQPNWIAHKPLPLRAEGLPDLKDPGVTLPLWWPAKVEAPGGFFRSPVLLIQLAKDMASHEDDGYTVSLDVEGEATPYAKKLPLKRAFSVGCSGQVNGYPCLVSTPLRFGGRIWVSTYLPDGTPQKLLDVSRMFGLGWRPTTGLAEGIAIYGLLIAFLVLYT